VGVGEGLEGAGAPTDEEIVIQEDAQGHAAMSAVVVMTAVHRRKDCPPLVVCSTLNDGSTLRNMVYSSSLISDTNCCTRTSDQ